MLEWSASGAEPVRDDQGIGFEDVSVQRATLSLAHRLVLERGALLAFEGRLERYRLEGEGAIPLPEDLQALSLQATLRQPINQQWSLVASAKPTFAQSGSRFSGDGFGFTGAALGFYRQSETLTWAVGLLYRSPTEHLPLLPVAGLDWRPSHNWSVVLAYPRSAVTYTVSEQVRVQLAALVEGGTFNLRDRLSRPDGQPDLQDTWLDYTEVRLGVGIEYRPMATLEVSALAGTSVHREFDYYERDYRLKSDDSPLFLSVAVRYFF